MPTVRTQRTVDSVLSQSKVLHMDKPMRILEPAAGPLVTMTMKAARKPVDNPTFYHRETELIPRRVVFTADIATVGTTATVSSTHGGYLCNQDCLFVPRTKEIILVTNTDTDANGTPGDLTIVKGQGGTTDIAVVNGDEAYIMPSAFDEDATAPTARMALEVLKTFYTQIFRDTTQVTKTMTATKTYHGNDRVFQQKVKMIEHKIKMEMLLLFGGTGASTDADSDLSYIRHSVGLAGWITNVININGAFTRPELWAALRDLSEYHYGDWLLVVSPLVASVINGWAIGALEISPESKTYGVDLQRLITPHGTVHLLQERLLRGAHLSGWSYLLPMPIENYIKYRPLIGNGENRDTRLMTNIKTDDDPDYYKDQIKTEAGFEFYEAAKMARFSGITG